MATVSDDQRDPEKISEAATSSQADGRPQADAAADAERGGDPVDRHDSKIATYGPMTGIVFVEDTYQDGSHSRASASSATVSLKDLFQPPRIFQWISKGTLYRSKMARETSKFELFADLVLVGVVHQLAETATEEVSGRSVGRFILTFGPTFSMWSEMRNYLNGSGVDDLLQRLYMLVHLMLLVGYSVNASAIELPERESLPEGEEAPHMGPGFSRPLVAAVTFYLISKLLRILQQVFYAYWLPSFASALAIQAFNQLIVGLLFMGIIFSSSWSTIIILASVGIGYEQLSRFFVGIARVIIGNVTRVTRDVEEALLPDQREKQRSNPGARHGKEKHHATHEQPEENGSAPRGRTVASLHRRLFGDREMCLPALNLEHLQERSDAFVTVVLGEMVVDILYIATSGNTGLSVDFGRASFTLIIVFCITWGFFSSDLSNDATHAVRRSWFTAMLWNLMFFPLCASLILASAAAAELVLHDEVEQGIRWYFGGGLAVAAFCIVCISMLHKINEPRKTIWGRPVRVTIRASIIVAFAVVPLGHAHMTTLAFLGTYAGISAFVVIVDVAARLGKKKRRPAARRPENIGIDTTPEDVELVAEP